MVRRGMALDSLSRSPHDQLRVFVSYLYQAYIDSLLFEQRYLVFFTIRTTLKHGYHQRFPLDVSHFVANPSNPTNNYNRRGLYYSMLCLSASILPSAVQNPRTKASCRNFLHPSDSSVIRIAPNHVHVNDPDFFSK
ncbi:putative elymoclavine monooxygenase protein [Botrytis fragariae]|uniref:Putative elymoclavine monooxygenase protein n=1 Tax=Botrytis fragariae TaxID=1964551 RepID=A0A8H6ARA2_9HELO|nr:putative elymoclavine monooxygenase protein [Botrytis fragariae]KAF5872068.1 putative elymoclavine monooxygenase protein [Botrytis fragariae]